MVESEPQPPRNIADMPSLDSLAAYVELFRTELLAAGWHLHEETASFGIGTLFKSGKPKKTPSIWIRYFEFQDDTVYDDDLQDFKTERRESKRPWRVDSWRMKTGKTFRDLREAFALFMKEARSSDANKAGGAFAGH